MTKDVKTKLDRINLTLYNLHVSIMIKGRMMMSCKVLRNLIMTTMISAMIPTISFATEGIVEGNAVRLRKEPSASSKIITLYPT